MADFDNFSIAVLAGAVFVIVVIGVMLLLDRGRPAPPASTPSKVAGKR